MSKVFEIPLYPYKRSADQDSKETVRHRVVVVGAGPVGFFPPQSIWPFWCALVVAIMCLGPIFGWWISLLGLGIGIWAASGWAFEYYRGDYAH